MQSEAQLVAALRAGDEGAFRELVEMYHAMLVRVARMYVSSQAVAEDVAAETWLAVLEGIDRFEGRSSLKTWIFRILANVAREPQRSRHRRRIGLVEVGGLCRREPHGIRRVSR